MKKMYYELHITIEGVPDEVKPHVVASTGWTFSAIDGDPVLGVGVKCYATRHIPAHLEIVEDEVLRHLTDEVERLEELGCKVIREKVELVMHDRRFL